jgi:hypothetical protein
MTPAWLGRIETLGTTVIVLMVGGMMIWYEAVKREGLPVTIACAVLLYAAVLVAAGRRSDPAGIAWWPFAAAGLVTGAVSELINARFLITVELAGAMVTGLVVGTAHWAALRVWIDWGERRVG